MEESQVFEIRLSFINAAKENFMTPVNQEHLVEVIVNTLSSLVQRRERCSLTNIRQFPQSLDEIKSSGRVQATSGIVESLNTGTCSKRFRD